MRTSVPTQRLTLLPPVSNGRLRPTSGLHGPTIIWCFRVLQHACCLLSGSPSASLTAVRHPSKHMYSLVADLSGGHEHAGTFRVESATSPALPGSSVLRHHRQTGWLSGVQCMSSKDSALQAMRNQDVLSMCASPLGGLHVAHFRALFMLSSFCTWQ